MQSISKKKSKILMIVENNFPRDIRVKNEAYALKDIYDITIIAIKNKNEKRFEIVNGVHVYRIPELTLFKKNYKPDGSYAARLFNQLKSKTGYILEYGYFTIMSFTLSIYIYFKRGFNVIHAHNPPDTIFIIYTFFKIFGVKFVFDHHDLSPELYLTKFSGKKNLIYKILILSEKLSCKLAGIVIATNESYKKIQINRHQIDSNKIFIVRNDPIIEDCQLKKAPALKKVGCKKVLLYIGSINPQDGVDVLLHSLHYLVNKLKQKNFICYILGDGDSLPMVKELAKELDLTEYIEFQGYVTNREVIKKYLHMADVCLESAPLNELNRHSTFIKIMEYMAAAKPIVAFDLEETRYSSNGAALLVKTGDIENFAKSILKLMNDPELRKRLGEQGFARIKDELNWENSTKNLIEAYSKLL